MKDFNKELQGFVARGKGGRRFAKGFTLKDPNLAGAYYVYVWEDYDKKKSNERREARGSKGYSYVTGWKSLGKKGEDETLDKLKEHLATKYGDIEENLQLVLKWLDDKEMEMEKKREIKEKKKMQEFWEKIRYYREAWNRRIDQPSTFDEAKKILMNLYKEEINEYKARYELKEPLPITLNLREKLITRLREEHGEL